MSGVDLTRNTAASTALFDQQEEWRVRAIERLAIESVDRLRVTSRYHCEFSHRLLGLKPDVETARLLVPLTTRQKRPLLNFRASVHGTSTHLASRGRSATVQTSYLVTLARRSSVSEVLEGMISLDLLRAVCAFSPDVWRAFLESPRSPSEAMRDYLVGGIGVDSAIDHVDKWMEQCDRAGSLIADCLGEPRDAVTSSAEMVLLALPQLINPPADEATIENVVCGFLDGVRTMYAAGEYGDELALDFLSVLGEYGRRWEVLLEAEVPLDAPVSFTLEEDRTFTLEARTLTISCPSATLRASMSRGRSRIRPC